MTPTAKQDAYLKQSNICVIATADGNGQPHATPVWYLYEDGVITVIIVKGSGKHRNLLVNPRVSVAFDERSTPAYALMINGVAELDHDVSEELLLSLAVRYHGEEGGRRYVETVSAADMVAVRLRADRIVEHMPG